MNKRNLQSAATFFIPWLVIFATGLILSNQLHDSLKFFSLGFGITSLLTLLALWWSGTGAVSQTPKSVLITLAAISLKMFACAIIFIYYFHKNKGELQPALQYGSIFFFLFTTLEVYIGLKFSKREG